MDALSDELWPKVMDRRRSRPTASRKIGMVIDRLSANHVPRDQFFAEIRRQIPLLQQWVTSKNLLTLDPDKPLEVRETPMYQRGVAGASIEAPGPYRPQDRTYYNVTPLDGCARSRPRAACANTTTGSADPEYPRGDPGPLRAAGVREQVAIAGQVAVR